MTRYMADSTNLLDCPQDVDIVASYLDGIYTQPLSSWDAFPDKVKVGIVISAGTNAGQVLDIERGDAAPSQAGPWAKMRVNSGLARATLYCARKDISAVVGSLEASGLYSYQAGLWIATLDGTIDVSVPGAYPVVAIQYANSTATGGHYDKSIVYDDSWPPQLAFGAGGGTISGGFTLSDTQTIDQIYYSVVDGIDSFPGGTGTRRPTWELEKDAATRNSVLLAAVKAIPSGVSKEDVSAAVTAALTAFVANAPEAKVPSLWDVLKVTFGK